MSPLHGPSYGSNHSASSGLNGFNRVGHLLGAPQPPQGAARHPSRPPLGDAPARPAAEGDGLPHRTTHDDSASQDALRTNQVLSGPHATPHASDTRRDDPRDLKPPQDLLQEHVQANHDQPDASWLALPFGEFLGWLSDWITGCDFPSADDGMFHLARGVKSHPATASMSALDAWAATCNAVEAHHVGLPELGADLFEEDGEVDFVSKWEKVRLPFGVDPVAHAFQAAGKGRLITQTKRPGRYSLFLTMAALLQLERGCAPILLPVHVLKQHFGSEPKTISSWLRWATADGVLKKLREHAYRPGGKGRAAEYVFGLHRWPESTIRELAQRLGITCEPGDLAWIESTFNGTDKR